MRGHWKSECRVRSPHAGVSATFPHSTLCGGVARAGSQKRGEEVAKRVAEISYCRLLSLKQASPGKLRGGQLLWDC
jgi:hypothetical protein